LLITLGEAEDQRFELSEPAGRVFARSEAEALIAWSKP
jgi:hypothetical protein